jgi:hypothetical protein
MTLSLLFLCYFDREVLYIQYINQQIHLLLLVLVVGPISTAAMRAYCTLTPQWSSVIPLQRRCTPSGVRDL